jgi:hypothetical protein
MDPLLSQPESMFASFVELRPDRRLLSCSSAVSLGTAEKRVRGETNF